MGDSISSHAGGVGGRHDGDVLGPRGEIVQGRGSRPSRAMAADAGFIPPVSAIGPLFRYRLERIYRCRVEFHVDVNNRATTRRPRGYYKSRG